MVKTFISMVSVALILLCCMIFENRFINKQFTEFNEVLCVLYEKGDEESATINDVYAVQENWLKKKKFLHIFIPHTEIKEVDLWLS